MGSGFEAPPASWQLEKKESEMENIGWRSIEHTSVPKYISNS